MVQAAAILADRDAAPAGEDPRARLARLGVAAGERPTETRRSEAQVRLQQFSTPLPYAHVAAAAASIGAGDLVLEPSAGTGALAHMARTAGAKLLLNEIDSFRALSCTSSSASARATTRSISTISWAMRAWRAWS